MTISTLKQLADSYYAERRPFPKVVRRLIRLHHDGGRTIDGLDFWCEERPAQRDVEPGPDATPEKAIFLARFKAALALAEAEEGHELDDFDCEGLEVNVAAEMVDEGLINDIDEVLW